jgi:DNA-binding MarR family transcriptional regulator
MTVRKRHAGQTPGAAAPANRGRHALDALRRVVRGLRVAARQIEGTARVSAAQLFVLQQLAEIPTMSLQEIADRTMTDRTSVAHLLDRLEAEGYIARARAQFDRRRYEIVMTSKGKALLARAPLSPTGRILAAMERLSASELDALTLGLHRLVEELGLDVGPAHLFFADTPEGTRVPSGPIGRRSTRVSRK